VPGLTFDTGALIALEGRKLAMTKVFHTAIAHGVPITAPAVVVAEWWRRGDREKQRATLLRAVYVESLDKHLAMAAGVALGTLRRATAIDAIVMASAATRGDTVYTSDFGDLDALRAGVPAFARVQIEQV
jgi:predicted nucleic acid-binding protein